MSNPRVPKTCFGQLQHEELSSAKRSCYLLEKCRSDFIVADIRFPKWHLPSVLAVNDRYCSEQTIIRERNNGGRSVVAIPYIHIESLTYLHLL